MTLEEILECNAEQLSKLTDEQLLEYFKQYLDVTRPERAAMNRKTNEPKPQQIYLSPAKKNALSLLADEGIDLSFMTKRKKR